MAKQGDQGTGRDAKPGAARNPGDEAPRGAPATGEDVCPVCKGEGRRGGSACAHCGGTGRVTKAIGGG